jgi:triosephosphate isomerase (TIM)
MTRKKIVAGNWKMHKDYEAGRDLAQDIIEKLQPNDNLIVLGTPFIHLKGVSMIAKEVSNVAVAAQNCHYETQGAFTGEISAAMVYSTGARYVILGHSERRTLFGESDATVFLKVKAALANQLTPIVCVGESLEHRESNSHLDFVAQQLQDSLFGLTAAECNAVVLAYEPVWAIGTGKTASPDQAQEMHAHIRSLVSKAYDPETAAQLSILYGGSVKPANAAEIFAQPDVDGGLIGGASLVADDFIAIVNGLQ